MATKNVFVNRDLDRRIKTALTHIDVAIAHLKSATFGTSNPNAVNVEMAIGWLVDAKRELQSILDDTINNTVVFINSSTIRVLARRARIKSDELVEALVDKCINDMSEG